MSGMVIGFGVGIRYPANAVIGGVEQPDKDNVLLFDDNSEILWEDETNILTEE